MQAAQCKSAGAAARRFIGNGLRTDRTRAETIKVLQPNAASLYHHDFDVFVEPRTLLADDPTPQTLYARYAREMPVALRPQAPQVH